jgi:hypothetical protein
VVAKKTSFAVHHPKCPPAYRNSTSSATAGCRETAQAWPSAVRGRARPSLHCEGISCRQAGCTSCWRDFHGQGTAAQEADPLSTRYYHDSRSEWSGSCVLLPAAGTCVSRVSTPRADRGRSHRSRSGCDTPGRQIPISLCAIDVRQRTVRPRGPCCNVKPGNVCRRPLCHAISC